MYAFITPNTDKEHDWLLITKIMRLVSFAKDLSYCQTMHEVILEQKSKENWKFANFYFYCSSEPRKLQKPRKDGLRFQPFIKYFSDNEV